MRGKYGGKFVMGIYKSFINKSFKFLLMSNFKIQ